MIDHDVVRFDVPVHDSHAVAIVESTEELVEVVSDCHSLLAWSTSSEEREGV